MEDVLKRDIESFAESFPLKDELRNSRFLITGATGLIGSTLIRCLSALEENIQIVAPVRNIDKARVMFGGEYGNVAFELFDLLDGDYNKLGQFDYVVHCASPTASKYFVSNPVETINTIFNGTKAVLDYSLKHKVKSVVYLSSLEVYGTVHDDSSPIAESFQGYIDPQDIRSSYPMAKRAAENLCVAYAKEYGVPVCIARLTQTTGAGIGKDDNRIIAQFARLASKGDDIILHTTGESARPYCYTTDAASGILYILIKGKAAEAYNVANDMTYISAFGMAEFLKANFNQSINIRMEPDNSQGYAPPTKLRLSSAKLRSLGWNPQYGLQEIFNNLIEYLH